VAVDAKQSCELDPNPSLNGAAMRISCLMPTYGRPTLVQNAIACFLAQDYPADKRRLLILDDAGQIAPQHGAGWFVWSVSLRKETLTAKYSQLDLLDAGWADAFVIWDDDDIYLPWHLSAHAAALREAQWSHPTKVWSLYSGRPELGPADGRFWAAAAIRVELLRSLKGFIASGRADFDQAHLRAWRQHGGEPGRPEPPSYVYGWGRSKHCSGLMISPDNTSWYSLHEMTETGQVERIIPRMDAQTEAIYAALA
jgi:hypothetical protein